MEQRFKDALRQIYRDKLISNQIPNSYSEELFKSSRGYFISSKKASSNLKENLAKDTERSDKSVTEKTLILDSFHQFGQDKLIQNDNKPISVEGGEILAKNVDSDGLTNNFELESCTKEFLEKYLIEQTSQELTELRYPAGKIDCNKIKVLFVSDSFCEPSEQQGNTPELREFASLFETATAQLFSRMISAMKLTSMDYLLSAVKNGESNCLELVLNEIDCFKPDLIISLGVTASHSILGINKRLKEIHGKFYKIQVNDFQTEVMPLFSPNLLNTAVNMKKIAWEDMQKAMNQLSL